MFPLHRPLALLPDVGGGELMLVLLMVLLLFGGDKMPQLAKSLGKSIRDFKRAASEVEREIKHLIDEVPDTPDLGTTLREAAEETRRKHRLRSPPEPRSPAEPSPSIESRSLPDSSSPSQVAPSTERE